MKCLILVAALVAAATSQEIPTTPNTTTEQPLNQQPSPWIPLSAQTPLPGQPVDPASEEGQHEGMRLRCQEENGTVPYWLDKSCRSYLSCVSFNLSLQVCGKDQAYSFRDKMCRSASEVNCSEQNREFTAVIRAYLAPHFYRSLSLPTRLPLIPFSASNAGSTFRQQLLAAGRENGVHDNKEEEELVEEDGEDFPRDQMTIDLDDLPSIIVDSTNAVNITLPEENCIRLGSQVKQLETSMNQALLMLVGCPEQSCDVTLFRVSC